MLNSLKIKILTLVACLLVLIVSSVAYVNFTEQKELLHEIANRNTILLTETIKSSIGSSMLSGHTDEIRNIFARVKSHEFVTSLRVVDESGKILASADQSEVGKQSTAKQYDKQTYSLIPGKTAFHSYSRINNATACHRCHPSSQELLGLLEIGLSLDYVNGFVARERNTAILSTLILVFLIISTIGIFLVCYVDIPIRKLIGHMKRVENGDFSGLPSITSSNEMRTLSESFSAMVEKLKALMDSSISHERELTKAQEKLSYHRETQLMNTRLEEQIKEIENLNITLEERIEEIEEANYKIADLAGELEDKNTNLEKAVAKLSTLYRLGLAINSTMEVEKLFQLVVQTTMDTLHAEIGYINLWDPHQGLLKVCTMIGHKEFSCEGSWWPVRPSSISGWVIENRKPLLITDMDEAPEFDRMSALGFERKTLICAPLMVKEEIIGTITAVNKVNASTYSYEELELLSTIAAQASIAIKNAKLYDEQQKTYLNTIQALVSAIEASDSYTSGHSERVTRYSLALGKKLGLPQPRLKVIERAAILHDIGKIGIDLSLLHKEARLTPADISELQQHPTIGMKILEPIEFLHDVRLCIGQHHERWDGQGYPNNVPGDELLLESRILAIADSFDAMTSDRPYRKALELDLAIEELLENAGTQFDPELVRIFVTILRSPLFHPKHHHAESVAECAAGAGDCCPHQFVL